MHSTAQKTLTLVRLTFMSHINSSRYSRGKEHRRVTETRRSARAREREGERHIIVKKRKREREGEREEERRRANFLHIFFYESNVVPSTFSTVSRTRHPSLHAAEKRRSRTNVFSDAKTCTRPTNRCYDHSTPTAGE